MRKFELSVSPDYVSNWSIVDATRELFQNALDEQITNSDSTMFFEYDGEAVLRVGNHKSTLEIKSLLLGVSTKREDNKTIGKFGEGYKIASLVLTRLGKEVTFFNYGAREIWKPRFVNSRRYGTQVLTFFVDRKYIWQSVPDKYLTIEVQGVTPEEWTQIVDSNLHLQTLHNYEQTPYGRILHDERHKGKVYVNGLYICSYEPYKCGYDFKPECIRLDRDRKLMSDFDLTWLSSKMWNSVASPRVAELAKESCVDVKFLFETSSYGAKSLDVAADEALKQFKTEFGDKAVPVTSQYEMQDIPRPYKPVIVGEVYKKLITSSVAYVAPDPIPKVTLHDKFRWWLDRYRDVFTGSQEPNPEALDEFEALMEELKELEGVN